MIPKPRLLIVEDEVAIRTGLVDVFVFHGFEVTAVDDGEAGLAEALGGRHDLVLLDVMLPGRDGFSVCQAIREQNPDLPVILLTARSADEDVIQGLQLGADDYVAKPFSVAQLVLRVQAVLRRSGHLSEAPSALALRPDLTIDTRNLSGERDGAPIRFTRREMDLILYLHGHSDRPVPREELLHKVWGYARTDGIETRTVDIHVARLRRKLERDPKQPRHLVTVRGGGYRLLVVSE